MSVLSNILHVFYEEFTEVFHDKGILIFLLFVPLCYPLLYSYVYTNEVVREVPAAVVDECHSKMSRDILRELDGTPDVNIVRYCDNMDEAQLMLKRQEVYGIVRIPSTLDEDLSRGKQSSVALYCDMSSMLYYKALLLAVNNVTLNKNKDIKVSRYLHPTTIRAEKISKMPIDYRYVSYYNPQSGFACFLIPPVLMLILQQTIFLSIGMAMGRSREKNGGYVINFHKYNKNPIQIVLGKALFYFMMYLIMAIYSFTFVNNAFSLPRLGHFFTFLMFVIPFLLACVFCAMVLSIFVYRREDCLLIFVFLSVPLLFMSGISWPTPAIPRFWQLFSYIFPSTFGLNGYVRVSSMGASLNDISFEYTGLWIQVIVYFLLAVFFYNRHIQLFKKRKTE